MITWTSKALLVAISMTALSACQDGQGSNLFAGALGADPKPLSRADMAGGTVTLVAPPGFCIDSASLKQRFALMARCDRLGAASAAGAAPLGVITVTLSRMAPGVALPDPRVTGAALKLSEVSAPTGDEDSQIFRARGPVPTDDLDGRHWRATALINGHLMGVAVYGPKGDAEVQEEGRSLITTLIERTRVAN